MAGVTRTLLVGVACFGMLGVGVSSSQGAVVTWLGTNGSDWFDAGNWDTGAVPTAVDEVVIQANNSRPGVVVGAGQDALAKDIFMNNSGNAGESSSLTVHGTVTLDDPGVSSFISGILVGGSSGTVLIDGPNALFDTGAGVEGVVDGGDFDPRGPGSGNPAVWTIIVDNGGTLRVRDELVSNSGGPIVPGAGLAGEVTVRNGSTLQVDNKLRLFGSRQLTVDLQDTSKLVLGGTHGGLGAAFWTGPAGAGWKFAAVEGKLLGEGAFGATGTAPTDFTAIRVSFPDSATALVRVIPEPSSLLLAGLAVLGLAGCAARRRFLG